MKLTSTWWGNKLGSVEFGGVWRWFRIGCYQHPISETFFPFFFPLPGGCHSMIRHQMLVKHTTVLHLRFSMTYHVATRAVRFKKQVSSYILKRLKRRHHRCIPRKLFLNISGTASPGSMCYATYIQRQRSQEQSISRIYMGSWTTPPNKRNTSPSRVLLSLALCEKRKGKQRNGATIKQQHACRCYSN